MKLFWAIIAASVLAGCKTTQNGIDLNKVTLQVSMMQIIVDPDKYDGKRVEIQGYYIMAFENNALYFHEDDYRYSIYKNAIWMGYNEYFFNTFDIFAPYEGYITIEGVYRKITPGYSSLFSGRLEDITYISRRKKIE